jgi:hypothetical protein
MGGFMNIFALIFLLTTAACELLFCVLRLELPAKIARVLISPALLLCYLSINANAPNLWLAGALVLETGFNTLMCLPKVSKLWAELAFAASITLYAVAYFTNGNWAFVAPHINFTVFLVYFTLMIILYFRIYPTLPRSEIAATCVMLLYLCAFSACGTIGFLYHLSTGTSMLALGALLTIVYYIFTLIISKKTKTLKFGSFDIMALFMASRILLVFGFQLTLCTADGAEHISRRRRRPKRSRFLFRRKCWFFLLRRSYIFMFSRRPVYHRVKKALTRRSSLHRKRRINHWNHSWFPIRMEPKSYQPPRLLSPVAPAII